MRVVMKIYQNQGSLSFHQNRESRTIFLTAEPQFLGSKDRVVKSRSKIEQNN